MTKGQTVKTPDGWGEILDASSELIIVQLNGGGISFYSECELVIDGDDKAIPVM